MEVAAKSINTQLLKLRVSEGNVEAVKELVPKIGNINQQDEHGWTILHLSVAKGEEEMVNNFLEANADPNICSNGKTSPLMTAFNKGHYKIFERLIQKGANVNHRDQEDWSVLSLACIIGNEEIVDILLNANADLNPDEEDPDDLDLDFVLEIGHGHVTDVSIIKKLILAAGIDINKQDEDGKTQLFKAVYDNNYDTVGVLLKLNADPNIANNNGKTPLMEASYERCTFLVKILLLYGANINSKDAQTGRTALDWANRDDKIERILEDAKKASSMTGIGLEPQVAEHLSMVSAFLEQQDKNVDVAQLTEKMTEMQNTLESFKVLLGQDSVPDDDSD